MAMTTDAPLSWMGGDNKGRMCLFPKWMQNSCGLKISPHWNIRSENRPGLCAPVWNKNQCFYTRYLFHYVFALCLTKEANTNSICVHIPNIMPLPCQPRALTTNSKHLWRAYIHKMLQKATLPGSLEPACPVICYYSCSAAVDWR